MSPSTRLPVIMGLLIAGAVPLLVVALWTPGQKEGLKFLPLRSYVVRASSNAGGPADRPGKTQAATLDQIVDPEEFELTKLLAEPIFQPMRLSANGLSYLLEFGEVYRWRLRCHVGQMGEAQIDSGLVDLSKVELQVTNLQTQRGFALYVTGFDVRRVKYKAWRPAPGYPALGDVPELFGKLKEREAFDQWTELREKITALIAGTRIANIEHLDRFTNSHHAVYFDVVFDLREATPFPGIARDFPSKPDATMVMEGGLTDRIELFFAAVDKASIAMNVVARTACVDAVHDLGEII